eukprot:1700665-Rhodomonas_salina.2
MAGWDWTRTVTDADSESVTPCRSFGCRPALGCGARSLTCDVMPGTDPNQRPRRIECSIVFRINVDRLAVVLASCH